ncbi:MAG: nucleotide sugar dehydrogenase, partial [Chloroflexota bacterium]|nr:nucleotide sugar dehydrogenase [Chloroflexota bacterium]
MRVVVYGLWHLGCVTAACLADGGHDVVGLDLDPQLIEDLRHDRPPLYEPGLAELIALGRSNERLSFTSDPASALDQADLLLVAFDTPVNERDEADVASVRARLELIVDAITLGTLVLISSQVPVGFTAALEHDWQGRDLRYAYSPENLRLGKAIEAFQKPERVIVGLRDQGDQPLLAALFAPFCQRIEWMSIESAEMTKHALNAFLATSVTFINELSRLCELVGADAKEVERGLKSEGRIGPRAYLAPGGAFAGGTLARDVRFLVNFGQQHHEDTPLFAGVLASNDAHKGWTRAKVQQLLGDTAQPIVAVLGLTYKPGTDTLRRSASVELCQWLHSQGAHVQAHDPAIHELPDELRPMIQLAETPHDALRGADVAIVATEWPDYR